MLISESKSNKTGESNIQILVTINEEDKEKRITPLTVCGSIEKMERDLPALINEFTASNVKTGSNISLIQQETEKLEKENKDLEAKAKKRLDAAKKKNEKLKKEAEKEENKEKAGELGL